MTVGLLIRLEDEGGTTIDELQDPSQLLNALLPPLQDESFACLRFIDLYGNTTFNGIQSRALVAELDRIRLMATSDAQRALVDRLTELAARSYAEPHQYVKLYGD